MMGHPKRNPIIDACPAIIMLGLSAYFYIVGNMMLASAFFFMLLVTVTYSTFSGAPMDVGSLYEPKYTSELGEYETRLECPYCGMEYIYQLTGGQDKVACLNCRKEMTVPSILGGKVYPASVHLESVHLEPIAWFSEFECPYCKRRYLYGLRPHQDKIVCKLCDKEFPVPQRPS